MPPRRHLNLDQLESFVALAECGGMTAAAQRLDRSQPTVSQHLKRLEAQLSRKLVAHRSGGATLTAEGWRLLPFARGLLRLGRQFAERDSAAALRLGACSNIGVYLLPELLIELRRRGFTLPEVTIARNPQIAARLTAGELDVALLEWWDQRPGFESRIWRREPLVAILPPGHPAAERERMTLKDLGSIPLLGGEPGTGTGRLLRESMPRGTQLTVTMNLGSTEAVKRAVAVGLGASLVLRLSVAEHLSRGSAPFVVRALTPELRKPLRLVWRTELGVRDGLVRYLLEAAAPQPVARSASPHA